MGQEGSGGSKITFEVYTKVKWVFIKTYIVRPCNFL